MTEKRNLLIGGGLVGAVAVVLVALGNPANMGFCIACFLRDIAGAVGLQRAEVVQYLRPEIPGLILCAFIMALFKKEFSVRGGSSPVLRFAIGFIVMVGALVFLGCPYRMILRLAGGDLNALIGLLGFVAGICAGVFFLNRGFSLGKTVAMPRKTEGLVIPISAVVLLALLLAGGAGVLIFSESGPGSQHAPALAALAAGLLVGAIAQRVRLCMVGGIRDMLLFKDPTLLMGFIAVLVVALVGNIITGRFNPGFLEQPVAHTDGLWNFLGLAAVGFGSALLGGCPLRQLILAGEGNSDSGIAVLGMLVGAAFCHNFGLASSAAGTTPNGRIAVVLGLVILCLVGVMNSGLAGGKSKASSRSAKREA
ncbi:MAG: YedE-related selenium metabolism membrane protein [Oscillospiraceae bacterium]|jgi:YedE family putative selenium metabolism protein|nr:YedE-related selenium metabolism membrane protein [Oscillospiraceae bacterium]